MASIKPTLEFFFAVIVMFPLIFAIFTFLPAHEHHWPRSYLEALCIIIGFVGGSVASVIPSVGVCCVIFLAINCIRGTYRRDQSGTAIFMPELIKRAEHLAFLQEEGALSSLEVIGSGGGGGELFKAQLLAEQEGEEPKFIAIKKLQTPGEQNKNSSEIESRRLVKWLREIQLEINTVGHNSQRNLVPLAAHVVRPDCHYLVYQYMENGSLHDALKKQQVAVVGGAEELGDGSRDGNMVLLSWPQRLHVAVGIASGLEYLHDDKHIINRDLKPANILLDSEMEARIMDFGMLREIPADSRCAGTAGYYAPEYLLTRKFTTKCDVYSFGVILAALVTGKEPSDQPFHTLANEAGLVEWLRQLVHCGDYAEAIDPAIAAQDTTTRSLW